MTHEQSSQQLTSASPASDRDVEHSIGALLKLAGERASPASTTATRARDAAHASWQLAVRRKRSVVRKRRFMALFLGSALAASLFVTFMLTHTTSLPATAIAQIVKEEGEVQRLDQDSVISTAQSVMSNETIQTSRGRVALDVNGLSLRIDRNTRLVATSMQDMRLEYGRVYVDSGGANNHAMLRIHTPQGLVQHEGTQYQVSADRYATQVQVREGRVQLQLKKTRQPVEIGAGQAVTMNDKQMTAVQSQSGYGDEWSWVAEIAPDFDIEDRPLSELLAWLAREHGWSLRYASIDVEHLAMETRLHGAPLTHNTQQQLENIGLMTGTRLQVDKGVLLVDLRAEK